VSADTDRPVETRLQIPARLIARVREYRVHAGNDFCGIHLVNFVSIGAVFHRNGEKTHAGHGLKRPGRSLMKHSNAQYSVIAGINARRKHNNDTYNAVGDLLADHAASIANSLPESVRYCFISTGVPILWVEPKRL
jgi:hypothetical protein